MKPVCPGPSDMSGFSQRSLGLDAALENDGSFLEFISFLSHMIQNLQYSSNKYARTEQLTKCCEPLKKVMPIAILIFNLVPPPSVFEWEFLSDCSFPDHCLLVPFFCCGSNCFVF